MRKMTIGVAAAIVLATATVMTGDMAHARSGVSHMTTGPGPGLGSGRMTLGPGPGVKTLGPGPSRNWATGQGPHAYGYPHHRRHYGYYGGYGGLYLYGGWPDYVYGDDSCYVLTPDGWVSVCNY